MELRDRRVRHREATAGLGVEEAARNQATAEEDGVLAGLGRGGAKTAGGRFA